MLIRVLRGCGLIPKQCQDPQSGCTQGLEKEETGTSKDLPKLPWGQWRSWDGGGRSGQQAVMVTQSHMDHVT